MAKATQYALCETAWAFALGPNHVRELTEAGLKQSGGADTKALCGVTVAWDVSETTLELAGQLDYVCRSCGEQARALA